MKTQDITKSQTIFESIGQGDPYFESWQRDIHPILCEVALNPDQIQQLFKNVEAGSRTALGRGIDTVKGAVDKVSDAWFNKFGGMLQQSAPVKAFDQKYEKIKNDIAAANPNLAAKLAKYGEFAKNNPNLHKFLLAIAGSAASALGVAAAGGIGAGALAVGTGVGVATGIINIADRLLQGQAASTAIGRGATAGAIAGLTAASVRAAADLAKNLDAVKTIRSSYRVTSDGTNGFFDFFLKKEDYNKYVDGLDAIKSTVSKVSFMDNPDAYFAASSAADKEKLKLLQKFYAMASTPEYQEAARKAAKVVIEPNAIQKAVASVARMAAIMNPVISAALGQAAGGAGEKPAAPTTPAAPETPPTATPAAPAKESRDYKKVRQIFESVEANWHDYCLKKQFSIMMEADPARPGFFKRMAQKFTQKITVDQLQAEWEKQGQPQDSEQIAQLLQSIGVNKEVIDKTYSDLSLPAPTTVTAAEPSLDANAAATTSTTSTANAAPTTATTSTANAAPTTANTSITTATTSTANAAPGTTTMTTAPGDIFKDPDALLKSFDDWLNAGNNITPGLRAALRQALLDVGFVKIESRRQKLERIITETQKLKKQVNLIKRQQK